MLMLFVNIINYENPKKKFVNVIEGMINKNEYTANHLNFDPAQIRTHNGLIFDNIEEEKAYIYERNEHRNYRAWHGRKRGF